MTIAIEEQRIRSLLSRVETVEEVARTLPDDDGRRAKLMAVSAAALGARASSWSQEAMTATVVRPPSTSITVPCTKAASSLAR